MSEQFKPAKFLQQQFKDRRVMIVGMGGGGDAMSTPATRTMLQQLGINADIMAGIGWKRDSQDGLGKPRHMNEFTNLGDGNDIIRFVTKQTRLAPNARQRHPDPRKQTHLEALLASAIEGNGQSMAIINIEDGINATEEGLRDFCQRQGIEGIMAVDVGGDVLCTERQKESIRSPIIDQVVLAAIRNLHSVVGVQGMGADGEFPQADFPPRLEQLLANNGYRGSLPLSDQALDVLQTLANNRTLNWATESTWMYMQYARDLLPTREKAAQILNSPPAALRSGLPSLLADVQIDGVRRNECHISGTDTTLKPRRAEFSPLTTQVLLFDASTLWKTGGMQRFMKPDENVYDIGKNLEAAEIYSELTTIT